MAHIIDLFFKEKLFVGKSGALCKESKDGNIAPEIKLEKVEEIIE